MNGEVYMSITSTIALMGSASLACMVAEKIAIECGKITQAQYINLFTSGSLGAMAVTCVAKLISCIATL